MHWTVLALAPGRPLPSEALSFGARLGVPFGSRRPDPLRPAVLFAEVSVLAFRRRKRPRDSLQPRRVELNSLDKREPCPGQRVTPPHETACGQQRRPRFDHRGFDNRAPDDRVHLDSEPVESLLHAASQSTWESRRTRPPTEVGGGYLWQKRHRQHNSGLGEYLGNSRVLTVETGVSRLLIAGVRRGAAV